MGKSGQIKAKGKQTINVPEAFRIGISQILDRFRASDDQGYTFEAELSNQERALVHEQCRKMGMISQSSGRGRQRRISVYKTKKKVDKTKGKDKLLRLTFSEESKVVLRDLFADYPPGDEQLSMNSLVKKSVKDDRKQRKKDAIFSKPTFSKAEIAQRVEVLNARIRQSADFRQIFDGRSKLPIASFRDEITSTVASNQVVLVAGETGCGKTTQVPQYLLDYMWAKGEACKIVCTQPRRISATSVAERISHERGESIGDNIGYKIRLESNGGRNSSIVFCTNGILLRVLVSQGTTLPRKEDSSNSAKRGICDITHIIVDEIHERDRYSDFMLAIVRDMLPSYPHLRLVLMSATLDADRFSEYFGGCPIIRIPGFTHPVKTFFLEDVLSTLNSDNNNHLNSAMDEPNDVKDLTQEDKCSLDEAIDLAWSNDEFDPLLEFVASEGTPHVYDYQHSSSGLTALMVFAGKGRTVDICLLLSFGANCHLKEKDGLTALELAERENQKDAADILRKHAEGVLFSSPEQQQLLDKYLATANPESIDDVLIEQLIRRICIDSKDGAILVFLPGWDDINRTRERLVKAPFFKDASKFSIISLHSMVPSAEQRKVFKRPPAGCRKIILSTNIAESAITIDDVVYVIDSGRMKEKSYDPYNNVATLQSSWISKASAKQREGRAGRCQPGICYHLYSKIRAASLQDFQVPEIRRMSIEELCLQVKLLDPSCRIEEYLRKTLDPPVSEAIRNGIVVLQDIGALSADEDLTDLGEKLGSLPVHPLTSKMLFFAILVNCLDPALTLACALDYRDPFTIPMFPNEKKKADAAKQELASLYGGHSDQLAVIAASECWKKAKEKGIEARFCSQYFVSSGTMHMLNGMCKQLRGELVRAGFIPEDASCCSMNAHDPGILRAVLVAGLYPMVGRLVPNGKRSTVETALGSKVRLNPHSLNCKLSTMKTNGCPLVAFDEISRGDGGGMHIRNCTVVGPLPFLLLSTEIAVAPVDDYEDDDDYDDEYDDLDDTLEGSEIEDDMEMDKKLSGRRAEKIMSCPDNSVAVVVDRWLYFGLTAFDVAQIYCLRERLSAAILFKVTHPRKELPPALEASLYATARILSYDGLSGICLPAESLESMSLMIQTSGFNQGSGRKLMSEAPNGFLVSLMAHGTRQVPPFLHNRTRIPGFGGRLNSAELSRQTSLLPYQADSSKRQRGNAFRR